MTESQLKATHKGNLHIAHVDIRCFVLEDKRRVISGRSLTQAIGMRGRGQGASRIPLHPALKNFISSELALALVDEATGYQAERDKDELQTILSAYIAPELMPWTRRFPPEFYEQMFRLWGWQYRPLSIKRPRHAGKLTSQLIYEKLPPGVLEELRRKNPPDETGRRKHKHHQFLTDDVGNPHLEKQLAIVTTLMRISPNWRVFMAHFSRAFPSDVEQLTFDFEGEEEEREQ